MVIDPPGQVLKVTLGLLQAFGEAMLLRPADLDRRLKRRQLAPGFGSLARHLDVEPSHIAPLGAERGSVRFQLFLQALES